MKVIYLLVVLWLMILTSCAGNEARNDSGISEDHFNPPVIVKDTSVISVPLTLSAYEIKDDSIFTDGSIPTSWENAGIKDVAGLKLFLKQAHQWVMNNDKEKLASAIKYPLKNINNEQELLAAYDNIFTKEVRMSFATINFNQIFRNQQGVMTVGGKVWINQFGEDFKIFAINQ